VANQRQRKAVESGEVAAAAASGSAQLRIRNYYDLKVATHGATPVAADWTCRATQELRFVQLLRICRLDAPLSLNDVGCGYGALSRFLARRHPSADIDYLGFDVSPGMIREAQRLPSTPTSRFEIGGRSPRVADYCVASGIFNVKLDIATAAWRKLVKATLTDMQRSSRLGFAVNFIDRAAADAVAPELFTTTARPWLTFCRTGLNMDASLVGNYGLPEFTLLARHRH
jgi:SAM-dependent methyltransferase